MNSPTQKRRICNSWYHHKWFRALLVFIGADMFILGVSFALGLNLLVFFAGVTGTVIRVIIGIAYIIVAGYILKQGLHYKKGMKETYLLCQHCAHERNKEEGE